MFRSTRDLAFDPADFIQFLVPADGTRVIIDVDRGFNPFQGEDDDDDLTPIFIPDPDSIDVDLVLLEASSTNLGGLAFAVPRIVDSNPNDGRAGSAPVDLDFDGEADLPLLSLDPFFDGVLDAGLYFIGIVSVDTTVAIDANTGIVTVTPPNPIQRSGEYRLHVSVEDHVLPVGLSTNQSIFFDRASAPSGQLVSEAFDLTGYSAGDQPNLYFNYLLDADFGDTVNYTITSDQDPFGTTLFDLTNDELWRQNIVSLAPFAGHTNVQVTFNYNSSGFSNPLAEGLYLDDFIVGFAERGETVFNARGGEDGFSFGFGNSGEYQLEIRKGTDYTAPSTSFFATTPLTLVRDFDTNDRHSQNITIVAPDGSQLTDGDTFTISDGAVTQRFEFTDDAVTDFNNLAIQFTATDTSAEIANRIRTAINQSSQLDVEAASASGIDVGPLTDNRLNLFGAKSGSFLEVASVQDAANATIQTGPSGDILMPAILHDGVGDSNYHRVQSQVIIENNTISDAHAIGIWTEPGDRDRDPEDLREAPTGGFFFFNPFADPFEQGPIDVRHPFLEQPPVGNVYPGAVRNLPTLNESVVGGLAPGVVIRNNTVDQAGLAGIKVDGETRPFMIDGMDGLDTPIICDGLAMAIDAGGTRVVFEFEDVSGAPTTACGSGTVGGDGFVDGHVPIHYRRADGVGYNDPATTNPGFRDYGYSSHELMLAIKQAIDGSILVTNNMAELVTAYFGPSLSSRDEFAERNARTAESFTTAAVYIQGASNVYFTSNYAKGGGFVPSVSLAPVGEAAQPIARVVNNTIYGADGIESQFVGDPTEESNDLLSEAVITHVGRAHTGPYIADGVIGDGLSTLVAPQGDVDIYQVELMVGDRLIIDIDTQGNVTTLAADVADTDTTITVVDASVLPTGSPSINVGGEIMQVTGANGNVLTVTRTAPVAHVTGDIVQGPMSMVPDTAVRLFNDFGIAQVIDVVNGVPSTVNNGGVAPAYLDPESTVFTGQGRPGPVADTGNSFDPYVDFTAKETGTYFVAVSSNGNVAYDPNSLSGRTEGTGGVGDLPDRPGSLRAAYGGAEYRRRQRESDWRKPWNQGLCCDWNHVHGHADSRFCCRGLQPPGGPAATVGNQITFEFSTDKRIA